jgi:hypothetical protein
LSCVFLGIPLGGFLSGIIIRRYRALRLLLRAVAVLNLLTYSCFATGVIRMSRSNKSFENGCSRLDLQTRKAQHLRPSYS